MIVYLHNKELEEPRT